MMFVLIEGLPNSIVMMCLARVPFYLHPKVEVVSLSWRKAIRSPEFCKVRQEVKSSEDFICVCATNPKNTWQLYDPLQDLWITLPILPSKVENFAHFGTVSVSGILFVVGGGNYVGSFSTNEVWSYDPVTRNWAARAPMLSPRAFFACCVSGGKIVAAGGYNRGYLSKAEIYDPEKDMWAPLPDIHNYDTVCSGISVDGGNVHVVFRESAPVQTLDSVKLEWTKHDYGWIDRPIAVVRGSLYVMSRDLLFKQEREVKELIATASEFRNTVGVAMVGLGDDIYVIGGVINPYGWNCGVDNFSDVHVLKIGSERPVWRQVANMTKCNGVIMGCTALKI